MDKEHLNIHDPHNQYVWADDPPPRGWRLVVLAISVPIAAWVFTVLVLSQ
tara:strand:- start:23 stop:172 length:150 start_codon:yes stop_codon:yes gene_type:complete